VGTSKSNKQNLIKKIAALVFVLSSNYFTAALADYPNLEVVAGKVFVTGVDGQPAPARKDLILRQTATIKVENKSLAVVALGASTKLFIFEDTVLKLPEIDYETGAVEQLILESGKFRYQGNDQKNRTLETLVFRESLKPGDYVFWFNPATPETEVLVLEGELSFRGLENGKSHKLTSKQKSSFIGQMENGEIVYDELLRGRKIARGTLNPVQVALDSELKVYRDMSEVKKAKDAQNKKVVKRLPEQICDKPFAKLDQCVWRKVAGKCFRERCNANGKWAERMEMIGRLAKCTQNVKVESCSY
jgi:hypothetical protein